MEFLNQIPIVRESESIEIINKGWSEDKKYCLTHKGRKLLLRVFDKQQMNAKQAEFMFVQQVFEAGIPSSEPLVCEEIPETEYGYMLMSYLEGCELREVITDLARDKQVELGRQAGDILRTIHQMAVPKSIDLEKKRRQILEKKRKQLQRYLDTDFCLEGQENLVDFVTKNLDIILSRPICYQHGDYHLGNMIHLEDESMGLIDFNRWDFGDPIEEMVKVELFTAEISEAFAYGQIMAYFKEEVPKDFWFILKVYLFHNTLFSIVWATSFGEEDIAGMIARYHRIRINYQNGERVMPLWFEQMIKEFHQ